MSTVTDAGKPVFMVGSEEELKEFQMLQATAAPTEEPHKIAK